MTLNRHVKENLTEAISQEADVPLNFSGLFFSRFEEVSEGNPERLRIRITAKDDYQYRGTEVITFRRLDLSDLDYLLLERPRMDPRSTLYNLLPQIRTILGINLTEDDVEDDLVYAEQGGFRVDIKAKPNMMGWTGETILRFLDLPPISIPIFETEIRW